MSNTNSDYRVYDERPYVFVIFDGWEDARKFVCAVNDLVINGDLPNPDGVTLNVNDINDIDIENALELLLGVERSLTWDMWGFGDEYTFCDECNRPITLVPRHYGDTPQYGVIDDGIYCGECIINDDVLQEGYIESVVNNPNKISVIRGLDLAKHGFKLLKSDLESGFHPGQNDDPNTEYEIASKKYKDVIFVLEDKGQFDIRWSIWVREEKKKGENKMTKKDERYFKYEIRSVEAWRDDDGWVWNNSFVVEEEVYFAESALTKRKILRWFRDNGYLTESSKGRVTVEDYGDIIEICARGTGEPLFAMIPFGDC